MEEEQTDRYQSPFGVYSSLTVDSAGVIFVRLSSELVLRFYPGDSNYDALLHFCQTEARKQREEQAGTPLPLASKLAQVEKRVETLWTEIFTAHLGEMNSQVDRERTTLAGKVQDLCRLAGIEPQDAPWSL